MLAEEWHFARTNKLEGKLAFPTEITITFFLVLSEPKHALVSVTSMNCPWKFVMPFPQNKCWTEYKGMVYQKWRHNLWVVITGGKFLLSLLAQSSVRIMGRDTTVWVTSSYKEQFETVQFCLKYMEDCISRK